MVKIRIFLFLLLTLILGKGFSQNKKDSLRNLKILPVPMFWYTPETKFGFGVAAMFSFRFQKKDTAFRVSSVQIGEAYTQERQWINFSSFQLFPCKERFYIYGEAGYYQYRYYFYDIGNLNESGKKERYDIDFTRIRTNFLFRAVPRFYSGIRYWYENHTASTEDTNGFLLGGNYVGFPRAVTSTVGLVLLFDTRNHIFFPSKGWFTEFSVQKDAFQTGSDFNFNKWSADVSGYFPVRKRHVLALNGNVVYASGGVPFTQLPMLGGNKKMRGYYEGRFRDQLMVLTQVEGRIQLFPRWYLTVFSSVGWVADQMNHLQLKYTRFSGGLGIRFRIDTKNKINLRLDSALGADGLKNYFTFNEAF